MSREGSATPQQQLQLFKTADGKIHVRGLTTGQQLLHMPNGKLLLVNNTSSSATVSLPMMAVYPMPTVPQSQDKASFSVGDKIRIDPHLAVEKIQHLKPNDSEEVIKTFAEEAVGTVSSANASKIIVKFSYMDSSTIFLHCDAPFSFIEKLNVYSVNQLIKIKSDIFTVLEIDDQFQHLSEKLKGAIGQVIGIDCNDPRGKLFVQFDDKKLHNWVPKSVALPSAWMEPFQPTNPSINKEYLLLGTTDVDLFLKAVDAGDLRTARLLYNDRGVDAEARNADGRTALHIATLKGHYDLVEWLLNEAKVDVNNPDYKGYCAIHYAALGGQIDVLELLEAHSANPNIQDAEGNTALHVAIMKGKRLDGLMRTFRFQLGLRNKKGLNVIQQAVVINNFSAVKFILKKNELCDSLFESMPNSKSTVLHHVCVNKNYRMAKLLLNESNETVLVDRPLLLKKFLEAKDDNGATALLIACHNKDYSLVELLVESGADVKAVDLNGNTAILLAASSLAPDQIPSKDLSPAIFKVECCSGWLSPAILKIYESALADTPEIKTMIQSHPMLSLVGYLMAKGSSLESSNKAGKTGRDAVLTKGSPVVILKMLKQFLIKSLGEASCSSSCMGRSDCNQPSVFQLQCPHKPAFKACSKCFLLRSQQVKCGCDEEDFESIQGPGLQQLLSLLSHRQPPKEKPADASQHYPTNFTFIKASGGDVRDQFGNIYTYQECENGVCRRFRCDKGPNFKERCTAVVAEIKIEGFDINSPITGYKFEYCLEKPHDHPVAPLKRKIHDEEGAGPSTLK